MSWESSVSRFAMLGFHTGMAESSDLIEADPLAAHSPQRQKGTTVTTFVDENGFSLSITAYDSASATIDLTGKSLRLIVSDVDDVELSSDDLTANGSVFLYPVQATQTEAVAIDGNAHYWKLIELLGGGAEKVISFGRQLVKRTARS